MPSVIRLGKCAWDCDTTQQGERRKLQFILLVPNLKLIQDKRDLYSTYTDSRSTYESPIHMLYTVKGTHLEGYLC